MARMKAVGREYLAARMSVDRFLVDAGRTPALLQQNITLRDIRHTADRLEGTYLIRLFAEFETGLRSYWELTRKSDPPTRTRDLIDSIAAKRSIADASRSEVHAVREYRNTLIHQRETTSSPVPVALASGHLCRFFSFLRFPS